MLAQYRALFFGTLLGMLIMFLWQSALSQEPKLPKPSSRLEISVGGEVKYYKVPLNQVIHIITDEDCNNVKVQLIPDNLSVTHGQSTDKVLTGTVP